MKFSLRFSITRFSLLAAMAVSVGSSASAGTIVLATDSNIGGNSQFFSNVFGGDDVLANSNDWSVGNWSGSVTPYSASFTTTLGTLTGSSLVGKEWFIATGFNTYNAAEVALLSGFLSSGGSIWVVGEGPVYSSINTNSNALLTALGSSLRINGAVSPSGSVSIVADPFTTGVSSFSYGYASAVATGGTNIVKVGTYGIIAVERTSSNSVPDATNSAFMLLVGVSALAVARRKLKGR